MNLQYGWVEESFKTQKGMIDLQRGAISQNTVTLTAAKRDWAAFQVLIQGDENYILSVVRSPAFSPKGPLTQIRMEARWTQGAELPVQISPVGFISDDDGIQKSDILLNSESLHVEKGDVQPVWIEIDIPEDAQPGIYNGQICLYAHSMFKDEQLVGCLNFQLEVKDVTLPASSEYRLHLDLWQHLSNIARKHEVHLWSEEHFSVIEEYVKSLAALGQKAVTIIASEIPWSGQGCFNVTDYPSDLFEYSMIQVEKDREGKYHYSYSVMERYIDLCAQYGIDKEIEVFGLANIWVFPGSGYGSIAEDYPDAIRIRYYDQTDGCYKYMKSGEEIKGYIHALEQYFIRKGWIDKVLVVADEPADVVLYQQRLNTLRETAPSLRFKTAINHVEFIDAFKDQVQDFVPALQCACEEWELLKKLKKKVEGRILWYICCGPDFPNTFIVSPLVESQLIGLLTAFMELDGFLRWNYTVWPENPRERISYRYPGWKAGDTNFVYPARNGKPLLSLRYKNLKRGIELFELIQRVKDIHPEPQKVLEAVWNLILRTRKVEDFHPSSGKRPEDLYSLNQQDYQRVRVLLLEGLAETV